MKKYLLVLSILTVFCSVVYAQGWERAMGTPDGQDQFRSVKQLANGDFITTGWSYDGATLDYRLYNVLFSERGQVKWEKKYSFPGMSAQSFDIVDHSGGGYVLGAVVDGVVNIVQIDENGENTTVLKSIGWLTNVKAVLETSDQGLVVTGRINKGGGDYQAYIYKLNQNADSVWYTEIGGAGYQSAEKMIDVGDGYILCGEDRSKDGAYVVKVDYNGSVVWEKSYMTNASVANSVVEKSNGNLVVCGTTTDTLPDAFILELSPTGDSLDQKTINRPSYSDDCQGIEINDDGSYTLLVNVNSVDIELWNVDAGGNIQSTSVFGDAQQDRAYTLIKNSLGGYTFTGVTYSFGFSDGNAYIVSTDESGNSFTSSISGYLFLDDDQNCTMDSSESGLYRFGSQSWMVKVTPGPFGAPAYYQTTDINGKYEFPCEQNNYTIQAIPVNEYWTTSCGNSISVNITQDQQVSENNNIGMEATKDCYLPVVDITSTRFRPCTQGTYYVNYCNNGTADMDSSVITVVLDEMFTFSSSNHVYTDLGNNSYQFDIGMLASGDCGMFTITGTVSCDVVIGQAVCSKAKISPSSNCETTSATWDKSSLVIEGTCNGDTNVCFTITNAGEAMASQNTWRLYINDSLSTNGKFQLGVGETLELCFLADGRTMRLEADQADGHPGYSEPNAIIELCGEGNPIVGYVLSVPQDDADEFVEIECTEVTASFDPNDKNVIPRGMTNSRYIYLDDQLEYTIRFQNTGNDTAFTVRIVDTIDVSVVDFTSMKMLGASHSYELSAFNNGVVEWLFNDILLPDSSEDYEGSQGFVKFKVDQNSNNSSGTQIVNNAGIYFDYNEPVITSDAFNEVWETIMTTDDVSVLRLHEDMESAMQVQVYPNPVQSRLLFEMEKPGNYVITITSLSGKVVKSGKFSGNKYSVNLDKLSAGTYIYHLKEKEQVHAQGKIIKR